MEAGAVVGDVGVAGVVEGLLVRPVDPLLPGGLRGPAQRVDSAQDGGQLGVGERGPEDAAGAAQRVGAVGVVVHELGQRVDQLRREGERGHAAAAVVDDVEGQGLGELAVLVGDGDHRLVGLGHPRRHSRDGARVVVDEEARRQVGGRKAPRRDRVGLQRDGLDGLEGVGDRRRPHHGIQIRRGQLAHGKRHRHRRPVAGAVEGIQRHARVVDGGKVGGDGHAAGHGVHRHVPRHRPRHPVAAHEVGGVAEHGVELLDDGAPHHRRHRHHAAGACVPCRGSPAPGAATEPRPPGADRRRPGKAVHERHPGHRDRVDHDVGSPAALKTMRTTSRSASMVPSTITSLLRDLCHGQGDAPAAPVRVAWTLSQCTWLPAGGVSRTRVLKLWSRSLTMWCTSPRGAPREGHRGGHGAGLDPGAAMPVRAIDESVLPSVRVSSTTVALGSGMAVFYTLAD